MKYDLIGDNQIKIVDNLAIIINMDYSPTDMKIIFETERNSKSDIVVLDDDGTNIKLHNRS